MTLNAPDRDDAERDSSQWKTDHCECQRDAVYGATEKPLREF